MGSNLVICAYQDLGKHLRISNTLLSSNFCHHQLKLISLRCLRGLWASLSKRRSTYDLSHGGNNIPDQSNGRKWGPQFRGALCRQRDWQPCCLSAVKKLRAAGASAQFIFSASLSPVRGMVPPTVRVGRPASVSHPRDVSMMPPNRILLTLKIHHDRRALVIML